jgi:uncharacterized radical SAM superfamily Fe-S cluster-containing enzyme
MTYCPSCGNLVPGRTIERDGRILLEKLCARHGVSSVVISSDVSWFRESRSYVKPGQAPLSRSADRFAGCPESCGLCSEHRQHTCLPVIEINSACDLDCPVCLKNFPRAFRMTVEEYRGILEKLLSCEGAVPVVNISGGEPTIHPEFEEILRASAQSRVMQTTVSTNGIRLHRDQRMRDLFKETGTIVALQFDGFRPETFTTLRGRDLSAMKLELVSLLEKEGIRYSLTATVMKGVNDREIGAIADFFFQGKGVSLMFQPAAFTGKAARLDATIGRLTIPDVVREVRKSRYVREGDFNPLPCSHYSCFALAYYFDLGAGEFLSLKDFLGKEDYFNVISNRTLPGLEEAGFSLIKERIYDFWSAADSSDRQERVLTRIRGILRELSAAPFSPQRAFALGSASMKGVFIHHFMDADTFDLGRLMKCCNHYPQADGRLVPICAQNLFHSS